MFSKRKIKPSAVNENTSAVSKYFHILVKFCLLPIKVDQEKKIVSFKFASRQVAISLIISGFFSSLTSVFNYLFLDYEKLSNFYYKMFMDNNAIDTLSIFAMSLSMCTAIMCFWIFIYSSGNVNC